MAQIFPFPLHDNDFASPSERQLYKLFKQVLGEEYFVFYGRRWKVGSRNKDYEADFIIAKRNSGILLLEVKGGRWEKRSGRWYANGQLVPKSDEPEIQAIENKKGLIEYLRSNPSWRRQFFPLEHVIALPDSQINDESNDESICAYKDLLFCQEWIEMAMQSCVQKSSPAVCNDAMLRYLKQALLKDYTIKLRDVLRGHDDDLLYLTEDQLRLDKNLRRIKQIAIQGGAGTGKTLMAIKQVRRLASLPQVQRILFTCYNKELGQWLEQQTADLKSKCDVKHFHGLCWAKASEAGLGPLDIKDFSNWHMFLWMAAEELNLKYDAIVVDEGQSFKEEWWQVLFELLKDPEESYFYVFYDEMQQIYSEKNNSVPFSHQPFELTVNVRNTVHIHQKAFQYWEEESRPESSGVVGEPVWGNVYRDEKSMKKLLRRYLHKLIQEGGVSSKDIIILTPKGKKNSWLVADERLGSFQIQELESDNPGSVRFSTIQSFRGMERSVVILTEFDSTVGDIEQLFYLGASRARTKLIILISSDLRPDLKASMLQNCERIFGDIE